jgi:hypothetical protein
MADQLDTDEVLAVLEDGSQDDRLVGVYEAESLDFKGSPYRLVEPREQWELAKDVAALANRGGGLIVVGVQTIKDPARDEEHASKVAPFPHTMLDVKQVLDVVARDVYPMVERLDVRVFGRADKRLVAIVVPRQDPDREPFLLTRLVDEEGQGWNAFVLPRRSGTHTYFEPVGFIHRDIADGRRARRVAGSTTIAPAVDVFAYPERGSAEGVEEWLRSSATDMDRALGWDRFGVVYLAAVPDGQRSRPADFYTVDGFRNAFGHDRQLRNAGFGLTYALNVSFDDGSVVSVDAERTVLRVDATGHVLAGAAGTPEFLGWAMDSRSGAPGGPGTPLKINVVALSEWVYEFCRFASGEIASRWGGGKWTFGVLVRRAKSAERPLRLPAQYRPNMMWAFDGTEPEADERPDSAPMAGDPALDAIRLLTTIYGVFGLPPERIPFNSNGRFNAERLLNLR